MEHSDRSIAAEQRGVEENHHAILDHDRDGTFVRVASDSVPGRFYRVTAYASGAENADVIFTCKANDIHQAGRARDHGVKATVDGTTPCKHMTRAARRLERAGLIRWVDPHVDQGVAYAGRWVVARPTSPVVTDDLADAEAPRRATDSQSYRATMATLAPTAGDPFAEFPRY